MCADNRHMRRFAVAVVLLALIAAAPASAIIRPQKGMSGVTLGMTKGEVLLKAGEPADKDLVSLGTDGHPSITVWTYIRTGYNEEVATLTFSGNRLVKIELNLVKP